MRLALILFSVLTSLSMFVTQQRPPAICRGKSLPITLLPGPKMTVLVSLPLRFGGTREPPRPWVHSFPSDKPLRLVIHSRDEFSDFWKRLTAPVPPGGWVPPLPEIDFSKDMIVVSAMGSRPSSGYLIFIDGACEVDGQVEVFVSSVEDGCGAELGIVTYPADAVRLPRSDLPIVFRDTQIGCTEWLNLRKRSSHGPG
ncbi:MAG TPA: protease complex subunit PrcB family protein [Pyrinomonadaceae bacterium]|nr:protease complex subunit PrcB family protein [Pyrinomonadaceae bacterium]